MQQSLDEVLQEEERGRRNHLVRPRWLTETSEHLDHILMWLPITDLTTSETDCEECRVARLHVLLDIFELEAESNLRIRVPPVGRNLATQLNVLSNCLQLYLREKVKVNDTLCSLMGRSLLLLGTISSTMLLGLKLSPV